MLDGRELIENVKRLHREELDRFLLVHPPGSWDRELERQFEYIKARQQGELNELIISLTELGAVI